MKIAINRTWGGFGVSESIYKELGFKWDDYGYLDNEKFGIEDNNDYAWRIEPRLIAAIEKIGEEKASGCCAHIKITEIPDGIEWEIAEYDGIESVHEQHNSWS